MVCRWTLLTVCEDCRDEMEDSEEGDDEDWNEPDEVIKSLSRKISESLGLETG
jgi:hypothetical protein